MKQPLFENTRYPVFSPQKALEVGYTALMDRMGLVGALQFMMTAFPGDGDSVAYYRKLREGRSVADVVKEIRRMKRAKI